MTAAEQSGPGSIPPYDRIGGIIFPFRHNTPDGPGQQVEIAGGTALNDHGTQAPCGGRHGGDGLRRFGPAIGGGH